MALRQDIIADRREKEKDVLVPLDVGLPIANDKALLELEEEIKDQEKRDSLVCTAYKYR